MSDLSCVSLKNVSVAFGRGEANVTAVDDVSLDIAAGEVLGLVGESGCGKTTLSRAILGLIAHSSGSLFFQGKEVNWRRDAKKLRPRMQMVFQDPYASLNPRLTVLEALVEPLRVHSGLPRRECRDRAFEMMEKTGLAKTWALKYPHEFSGGQRQRIAIARSLILRPDFVIADEPVSALDVSIQARILNLLLDLREQLTLTLLFITHDLSVVKHVADRVAVMRNGQIIEIGQTAGLMDDPRQAYTRELLAAVPVLPEGE